MTETERGLLQAILDNPDDDVVRLVYADFCEVNGDVDRAEFIRLQVSWSGQPRSESFRLLFLFVACSLRLGDRVTDDIDECIVVPVSELERAVT